jgi:hypothetical protein
MIGIFGHQNLGDGCFGRQSALDQPGRSLGLHDAILTSSAGVFRTSGDDNAELRRHHVQPLALVFADPVQFALAAGADLVIDVDDDLDPRQMHRQRSAIDAALASPFCPAFRGCRERLRQIIKELQRHRFGRKAESLPEEQML